MNFVRAIDVNHVVETLRHAPNARVLAGGQSLIPAMKLGFIHTETLIDLRTLTPALRNITRIADTLEIGALCTHAQIAASLEVRTFCPMLTDLAGGIGDAQIRAMGTIGGSLANNDPAACWPAGVVACSATITTTQRTISADDFFTGLYTTALNVDEIITSVTFKKPSAAHYMKFEQPASRFALVGVAVARTGADVRVAVTGLGNGVVRWAEAETALSADFTQAAMTALSFPETACSADMHASAAYRAHLVRVLTRRCVQYMTAEGPTALQTAPLKSTPMDDDDRNVIIGSCFVAAPSAAVWRGLQDPETLRTCIPGCERFDATAGNAFSATVRVGLGPFRLLLVGEATLVAPSPLEPLSLQFSGNAGALGGGGGTAEIRLHPEGGGTRVDWRARIETNGKIAQLGTRLVSASTTGIARDFFARLTKTLQNAGHLPSAQIASPSVSARITVWWRRLLKWIAHK